MHDPTLINFTVSESDGANDTSPKRGTLLVCQAGKGSACGVRLPRHLYAAAQEMAQLAEDAASEAEESEAMTRIEELEARKKALADARAERSPEPPEDE